MPPDFCANAVSTTNKKTSNSTVVDTSARNLRVIRPFRSCSGLFVEPDVFHAPAVKDAVDHDRQPLDIGLPAGSLAGIKDDGPSADLGQFTFDRPQQLLPPSLIGLDRLLLDQLVHLRVAIAVPVQARTASV